ncbi:MAG TPA: hypothetical protein VFU31_10080 [Candidatus Binatia bacterium]|nr:hypothetical protein [Candidatus Binatia bacterium]
MRQIEHGVSIGLDRSWSGERQKEVFDDDFLEQGVLPIVPFSNAAPNLGAVAGGLGALVVIGGDRTFISPAAAGHRDTPALPA